VLAGLRVLARGCAVHGVPVDGVTPVRAGIGGHGGGKAGSVGSASSHLSFTPMDQRMGDQHCDIPPLGKDG
jgi:hypothetical protein